MWPKKRKSGSPSRVVRSGLLVLILGIPAAAGLAGDESAAGESADAADKVLATMQAAVADAPQFALRLSQLDARVAGVRSETGAGAPILTWQSEGFGGGFDRTSNAADFLRLSLPFNRPWQVGATRDLNDASVRLREIGGRATTLEVAGSAGRRWLDLAAATDGVRLAEARLDRLNRALAIQRKRYELGEIAGSESTQVELQQVREAAGLERSKAVRFALQRDLEALVSGGFPTPDADDLTSLVESTASPLDLPTELLIREGPFLRFAQTGAEVAQLEAERRRGTAWGQPEIEVEWERIPSVGGTDGFDAFGFRLSYPLPVGRQGRQRVLASEKNAAAAAAEHDLVRQQLTARFHAAREAARGAEAALDALEPAIAQASTIERSLIEQFRLGAISYLAYLDGFSRLDQVIQSTIEARHALLVARLELAGILGTDIYFPLPDLGTEDES